MSAEQKGGIFLSRDEMNPDERLAFDLGHAAATEQAKAGLSAAQAALEQAELRLTLIARNASSWHHDAEARQRALNVISAWATGGELPASLVADVRGESPPVETEEEG